jgi:hypothetical protein
MNLKNHYLQFLVNDQLIAYRATGENIYPVPTSSQTGSLPKQSILKQGGILHLYGHNFDLSKNGLYRFIINKNINAQITVNDGNAYDLCSSIAWSTAHGNALNHNQCIEIMKSRKLLLTCGPVSNLVSVLSNYLGLASRPVSMLCHPSKQNFYGSGHTFVEIFDSQHQKWVAYDPDGKVFFLKNKIPLSFIEFFEACEDDSFSIARLSACQSPAFGSHAENDHHYDFYSELLNTEEIARDFYRQAAWAPSVIFKNKNIMDKRMQGVYKANPNENVVY